MQREQISTNTIDTIFGSYEQLPDNLVVGLSNASTQSEIPNDLWLESMKEGGPEISPSHHTQWRRDYELASQLGVGQIRQDLFPISRLMKVKFAKGDKVDWSLDHDELFDRFERIKFLRNRMITLMPTLWHWDQPNLVDLGWEDSALVDLFVEYIETLMYTLQAWSRQELGVELHEILPNIVIANEPVVYLANSLMLEMWPPHKKDPRAFLKAINNMADFIKRSYLIIKEIDPEINAGISKNMAAYYDGSKTGSALNRFLIGIAEWYEDKWFINKMKFRDGSLPIDSFFVNYWHSWGVDLRNIRERGGTPLHISPDDKTLLKANLDPQGLIQVLERINRYHPDLPIHITEIGAHLPPEQEERRINYYASCLTVVSQAIQNGIPVESINFWPFMTNHEWVDGLMEGGVVSVDHSGNRSLTAASYAVRNFSLGRMVATNELES